jgi:hypothetical protein
MARRFLPLILLVLVLALFGASHAAAQSADLAPCERLATQARGLPDFAWVKGFKALAPQLALADRDAKLTPFEARLAGLASVKQALADEDGGYTVYVRQLAPNLFVASDSQGTLECETFVFLKTGPNGAATIVPGPPAFSERCWTDSGTAGRVFGQPAFVETSDFTDPAGDEQHLEITPWTGDGWGLPCQLTLTYRVSFAVTERFCGDGDVCTAATPFAADVAAAHGKAPTDQLFSYGPPLTHAQTDLLAKVGGGKPDEVATPVFPTFGEKAKTAFPGYSYNDVDLFPLKLKGVTYVAAIGYGGVGWRTIGDSLLAIYRVDGDQLKPLAGFVVVKSVTGLASATVDRPKPDSGH